MIASFRLPQRRRAEVALFCGPDGRGDLVPCWRGRRLGMSEHGADGQLPEQGCRGRDAGAVRTGTSCRGTSEVCHSGTHTMAGKFRPTDGSRKPIGIGPRQTIDLDGSSWLRSVGPEINGISDGQLGWLYFAEIRRLREPFRAGFRYRGFQSDFSLPPCTPWISIDTQEGPL
jgi:hypothetical protein